MEGFRAENSPLSVKTSAKALNCQNKAITPSTSKHGCLKLITNYEKQIRLFVRGPVFWWHDGTIGKQRSLKTRDRRTAQRLLFAENEVELQPAINLQIAKAYASGKAPKLVKCTWEW